jgi:hypothetical protein
MKILVLPETALNEHAKLRKNVALAHEELSWDNEMKPLLELYANMT